METNHVIIVMERIVLLRIRIAVSEFNEYELHSGCE